jgi:hypothetical protein
MTMHVNRAEEIARFIKSWGQRLLWQCAANRIAVGSQKLDKPMSFSLQ